MSQPGETRPVRIQTTDATIDGELRISPQLRTLDALNMVGRSFLTVHEPRFQGLAWPFDGGPLAVSTSIVIYVTEPETPALRKDDQAVVARYTRAPLRVLAGPFSLHGFVYVTPGGDSITRLSQEGHLFLALTSVSVVGPDIEFTTPFLAINRSHIVAAQRIQPALVEAEPAGVD